jgi:hypothetical protein
MIGVKTLQFYCMIILYGSVVWHNCMAYELSLTYLSGLLEKTRKTCIIC